eukprot:CAMPEP_0182876204 /NCGR_PEP_ID=MMETSP0034_2-20130328/14008_1 /TAXON_ID=156128 /ORGANISM="Nephroselmis pyriformis, Strain CCMP717" /LENGTH=1640 /DNA_ID=CAMNT_0025008979 /DNA_START=146 /DNA_END=5065 /DNA_ORIENTATION=+
MDAVPSPPAAIPGVMYGQGRKQGVGAWRKLGSARRVLGFVLVAFCAVAQTPVAQGQQLPPGVVGAFMDDFDRFQVQRNSRSHLFSGESTAARSLKVVDYGISAESRFDDSMLFLMRNSFKDTTATVVNITILDGTTRASLNDGEGEYNTLSRSAERKFVGLHRKTPPGMHAYRGFDGGVSDGAALPGVKNLTDAGSDCDRVSQGNMPVDTYNERMYTVCTKENGDVDRILARRTVSPYDVVFNLSEAAIWVNNTGGFVDTSAGGYQYLGGNKTHVGSLAAVSLAVSLWDWSLQGVFVRNGTLERGRIETCAGSLSCAEPGDVGAYSVEGALPSNTSGTGHTANLTQMHLGQAVYTRGGEKDRGTLHTVHSSSLYQDGRTWVESFNFTSYAVEATTWLFHSFNLLPFGTDSKPPYFVFPPTFVVFPEVIDVFVTLNEPGTVYYVVVPIYYEDVVPITPTTDQVRSGVGVNGATPVYAGVVDADSPNKPFKVVLDRASMFILQPYVIFVTAEDDEKVPNRMTQVDFGHLGTASANFTRPVDQLKASEGRVQAYSNLTLYLDEGEGINATYSFRLTSFPTSPVTVLVGAEPLPYSVWPAESALVHVSHINSTTGVATTAAPGVNITFDEHNWLTTQTVVLSAVNDTLYNPDVIVIRHNYTSLDPRYDGLQDKPTNSTPLPEVRAVINDDDKALVLLNGSHKPLSYNISEGDPSYYLNVALSQPPRSPVMVTFEVDKPSRLGLGRANNNLMAVTFDFSNYSTPVAIWLATLPNERKDDDVTATITARVLSTSPAYQRQNMVPVPPVSVFVKDMNIAMAYATPPHLNVTEAAASSFDTPSMYVSLYSQPQDQVEVRFVEVGAHSATRNISEQQLVFDPPMVALSTIATAKNAWKAENRVKVYGLSDMRAEGVVNVTVKFYMESSHSAFDDLYISNFVFNNDDQPALFSNGSVAVTIEDKDKASLDLRSSPTWNGETGLSTTVTLGAASRPFFSVNVRPVIECLSFACPYMAFEPNVTTLQADTLNTTSYVLKALDDKRYLGLPRFVVRHMVESVDPMYDNFTAPGFDSAEINVTVTSTVALGVEFNTSRVVVDEGKLKSNPSLPAFTERGFTVRLLSEPLAPVTIRPRVSGQIRITSGLELRYDNITWNQYREVRVQAIDDEVEEGYDLALVSFEVVSEDPFYNNLTTVDMSVIIRDNEVVTAREEVETFLDPATNSELSSPLTVDLVSGYGVKLPQGAITIDANGVPVLGPRGSVEQAGYTLPPDWAAQFETGWRPEGWGSDPAKKELEEALEEAYVARAVAAFPGIANGRLVANAAFPLGLWQGFAFPTGDFDWLSQWQAGWRPAAWNTSAPIGRALEDAVATATAGNLVAAGGFTPSFSGGLYGTYTLPADWKSRWLNEGWRPAGWGNASLEGTGFVETQLEASLAQDTVLNDFIGFNNGGAMFEFQGFEFPGDWQAQWQDGWRPDGWPTAVEIAAALNGNGAPVSPPVPAFVPPANDTNATAAPVAPGPPALTSFLIQVAAAVEAATSKEAVTNEGAAAIANAASGINQASSIAGLDLPPGFLNLWNAPPPDSDKPGPPWRPEGWDDPGNEQIKALFEEAVLNHTLGTFPGNLAAVGSGANGSAAFQWPIAGSATYDFPAD